MSGVGDDVRKAPGTDREDLSRLFGVAAERVESGTSLRAEDEVAGSQGLLAVLVPEDGTTVQDEEQLFGSEVDMHPHLRRVGPVRTALPHPGAVRPPEDSMPSPGVFVLSVPCVGEEVLTIHAWYLRVVAVDAQPTEPAVRASATLRRKRAAARRAKPLPRRRIHSRIMPTRERGRRPSVVEGTRRWCARDIRNVP